MILIFSVLTDSFITLGSERRIFTLYMAISEV